MDVTFVAHYVSNFEKSLSRVFKRDHSLEHPTVVQAHEHDRSEHISSPLTDQNPKCVFTLPLLLLKLKI